MKLISPLGDIALGSTLNFSWEFTDADWATDGVLQWYNACVDYDPFECMSGTGTGDGCNCGDNTCESVGGGTCVPMEATGVDVSYSANQASALNLYICSSDEGDSLADCFNRGAFGFCDPTSQVCDSSSAIGYTDLIACDGTGDNNCWEGSFYNQNSTSLNETSEDDSDVEYYWGFTWGGPQAGTDTFILQEGTFKLVEIPADPLEFVSPTGDVVIEDVLDPTNENKILWQWIYDPDKTQLVDSATTVWMLWGKTSDAASAEACFNSCPTCTTIKQSYQLPCAGNASGNYALTDNNLSISDITSCVDGTTTSCWSHNYGYGSPFVSQLESNEEYFWGMIYLDANHALIGTDETTFTVVIPLPGCMDDGSDPEYPSRPERATGQADNYDENATEHLDNSCNYIILGCTEENAVNYCVDKDGNVWCNKNDGSCIERPEPDLPDPPVSKPVATGVLKGGISNRVFGEDISLEIKRKLALRQMLNQNSDLFQSQDEVDTGYGKISKTEYNTNFDGIADLGSRTTFARLWTGIDLAESVTKDIEEYGGIEEAKKTVLNRGNKGKYNPNLNCIQKGNTVDCVEYIPQATKVYIINDHTLNTFSTNPNESVGKSSEGNMWKSIAPSEQGKQSNYNEFMRPPVGITSITSETEGPIGAIKKTSVSFTVHNFHDYDKIYSRYFLKHGAQVFVDFGWDTALPQLYDPKELLKNKIIDLDDALYGADGYVTRANGDLETLIGHVINYDAKITENGSVECTIDIISKNAALIDRDLNTDSDKLKNKIKYSLDIEVMRFAARAFEGAEELVKLDWTATPENIKQYDHLYSKFAQGYIQSGSIANTPSTRSAEIGVMFGGNSAKNKVLYISWGFFEDHILNTEFGFGGTLAEIQGKASKIFESRYNSSDSYVRYDINLYKSQKTRVKLEEGSSRLNFLYLDNWTKTYNTERNAVHWTKLDDQGIYIPRPAGKLIIIRIHDGPIKTEIEDWSKLDRNEHRYPLRDLFIPVSLIKEAVDKANTITDLINYICDAVNDSSQEIFNIKLGSTKYSNSEFSFIDTNFLGIEEDEDDSFLKNLFEFKPNSPNSIVQGYNLSFTTGKGGLQNMLAIQGMGAGGSIFPATEVLDSALAAEAIETVDNLRIRYQPAIGGYRGEMLDKASSTESSIQLHYDKTDIVFGKDSSNYVDSIAGYSDWNNKSSDMYGEKGAYATDLENITNGSYLDGKDVTVNDEDIPSADEVEVAESGVKLASSWSDYYAFLAKGKFFASQKSSITPVDLSLDIYGIATLVPGDLLKVDYLPSKYDDAVFFQIKKVKHNISSTGWKTSLETFQRITKKKKKSSGLFWDPTEVCITRGILDSAEYDFDPKSINHLKPYIKSLKLMDTSGFITDLNSKEKDIQVFSFRAAKSEIFESTAYCNGYKPGWCWNWRSDYKTSWSEFQVGNDKYCDPDTREESSGNLWMIESDGYREQWYVSDTADCTYLQTVRNSNVFTQRVEVIQDETYYLLIYNKMHIILPLVMLQGNALYYYSLMFANGTTEYKKGAPRPDAMVWNPDCDICTKQRCADDMKSDDHNYWQNIATFSRDYVLSTDGMSCFEEGCYHNNANQFCKWIRSGSKSSMAHTCTPRNDVCWVEAASGQSTNPPDPEANDEYVSPPLYNEDEYTGETGAPCFWDQDCGDNCFCLGSQCSCEEEPTMP